MNHSQSLLSRLYQARRENLWGGERWLGRAAQVIAVCNQKGGCAKTTTAINLAAGLSRRDHPTLLMDLDPQAHASLGLGFEVGRIAHTLYDLFHAPGCRLESIILPTKTTNLFLAPANALLSGSQVELVSVPRREQVLRRAIRELSLRFRFILIDCSPSLNLLTLNALVAADYVLVPVLSQYYALEGMKELFSTLDLVRERFNARLKLLGILPVMVDDRLQVSQEILQQIRDYFKDRMMQTSIQLNAEVLEASIAGQPVAAYAPDSQGAREYEGLVEECLHRLGFQEPPPQRVSVEEKVSVVGNRW